MTIKIITEEQYEDYLIHLESVLASVNGQYHNWIDSEYEQCFEMGDATKEQILDDAECFDIVTEERDLEDICNDVCQILKEELDSSIMNEIKIKTFKIDDIEYKLHYQVCEESKSAIRKIDLAIEAYNKIKRAINDTENILKGV